REYNLGPRLGLLKHNFNSRQSHQDQDRPTPETEHKGRSHPRLYQGGRSQSRQVGR
ncbi:hypothetical protein C8Q76DRAFT_782009, partial [Earliella scabrosa]